MTEDTYLKIIKSLINLDEALVVIFEGEELMLTNSNFNTFFGVNSLDEYKKNFSSLIDTFVLHPSYFNKNKVSEEESWFDAIMKLDKMDRVVSLLNQKYEPQAFSVTIDSSIENFKIVTFVNITQSLIKRIMIENHSNIDKRSGAYAKQYFLQIMSNYETASTFNEKIIGLSVIEIVSEARLSDDTIQNFVMGIKKSIRHDDMFVRWRREKFLLVYLVDDEEKVKQVVTKLKEVTQKYATGGVSYKFSSLWQREKESISAMLEKLGV